MIPPIVDSWESLDGWFDAIRLVYTIFARGKSDVLVGFTTGYHFLFSCVLPQWQYFLEMISVL